jgi:predicted transposase YbfD/YdcC
VLVDLSCFIAPIKGQGGSLATPADLTHSKRIGLLEALAQVPDPRKRRGQRHPILGLLAGILTALLCGARSLVEIYEVIEALTPAQRRRLGLTRPEAPSRATIRRTLALVDADELQKALTRWALGHIETKPNTLRHWAVDGKTSRGAAAAGEAKPHFMLALDTATGIVVNQVEVGAKTNEITKFKPLLLQVKEWLKNIVITADAMHVQTAHAQFLHEHGAGLLATVKANQPTLLAHLKHLPWDQIPIAVDDIEPARHGRIERRVTKVTTDAQGLPFAHAHQGVQTTRYIRTTGKKGRRYWKKTDTAYSIATLPAEVLNPHLIAAYIRAHWAVESLHWLRDVTLGEDANKTRTGHAPRNLAALHNTVISIHHHAGTTAIAKTLRTASRNPEHAINHLTSENTTLN